ncbi:MAG TPA: site-specific integrase, partial [Blastocatellia bacterium]|nr:site-specific integrase [Blastocatellia bacterium]
VAGLFGVVEDAEFARDVALLLNGHHVPPVVSFYFPVKLSTEVVVFILQCLPKSGEYVFTSDRTGRAIVEIKRAFRASCRLAGIEDLHFHDLRHTAATRWAEAGAQISTIAELLGHADLRMTARYTHATDNAKRRAVEAAARAVELGKSGHNLVTMKKREA